MKHRGRDLSSGFSLIELMLATSITLGVSLIVFQMFIQNERVFRDQAMLVEAYQNLRAVASMIADELRMTGQGVPLYAASHEATASAGVEGFLEGTNPETVRFRAGLANGTARARSPLTYTLDRTTELQVDREGSSRLNRLVGTRNGRHLYITGPGANAWTWVRSEITAFLDSERIQVVPRQISTEGGSFTSPPGVSLEEAISYRLSSGRILRGVARDFSDIVAPTFTESTLADGFTVLDFFYFDESGAPLDPASPSFRSAIRQVDFRIEAETAGVMADGAPRALAIRMSVRPPNLQIH